MSTRVATALFSVAWLSAASLTFLTSCSSLAGDDSGGRYTAPDGLFSLPLPALSLGAATEDQSGTDPESKLRVGSVSFHDDFGHVIAIQYEQIAADVSQKFSDPARATEMLRGATSDVTLANIQQFSPHARIVHEEPVTLPDGISAWFSVLEIPEGSAMVVSDAEHPGGRRLDSTRGFLLLSHGQLILTLSEAYDLNRVTGAGKQPGAQGGLDQAGTERMKASLVKLYASMSFK
jgi:hypothetical protein